MRTEKQIELAGLLRSQAGHVTRRQWIDLGLARSTATRRAELGLLVRVGAQTFRDTSVPRSQEGDVLAACLDHQAIASHRTAAWLHGLVPWPGLIDLTRLPQGAKRPHAAAGIGPPIVIHASANLPQEDRMAVRGIPTTSVARALFGLSALVPAELEERSVFDVVGKAVDGGLATDPWLWWLLEQRRCRGRNGVTVFEAVLAARARLGPTESWLERELLRVLEQGGLPRPQTQRVIRRLGRFAARVDCIYETEEVIVEALGYAFHRTAEQIGADTARANELQLLGYTVLQFTTDHIVERPAHVVETVRRARLAALTGAA